MITPQEMHDWRNNPVTLELQKKIDEEGTQYLTMILEGKARMNEIQGTSFQTVDWFTGAMYGLGIINRMSEEIRESVRYEVGTHRS